MIIFEMKNVVKVVNEQLTLNIEHFKVMQGERIGIVGLNGAGKTTLLHILLGEADIDSGTVRSNGNISWIRQTDHASDVSDSESSHTNADAFAEKERHRQISIWHVKDVVAETMSGGEQTRLKIAEAFMSKPDVLVADEPTTHLDLAAIEQLGKELQQFKGTLLLVSHDRSLLDLVCTKIVEVEDGKLKEYPGNYSQYREAKELELRQAEAAYEQYVKEKRQLEQAIEELRGKSSKMTKAPKRMGNSEARLHKGGIKQKRAKVERNFKVLESRLKRLEVKQKPIERERIRFDQSGFPPMRGKRVMRFDQLSLTVGHRQLIDSLTCTIRLGTKTALIGPNGSGKTSLLRAIYDQYRASGEKMRDDIQLAGSVKMAYFHQRLEHLDVTKSLLDNIRSVSNYPDAMIRTVLARLHFKRDEVLKPASVLSGGEKVKAGLAIVFLSEANVLLLDEPSNYLDIFTKEELEEMLADYPGTVLFASHDRQFIKKVASHVLEFDGDTPRFYSLENETTVFSGKSADTKDMKQSDDRQAEKMVLEMELSEIIGRISIAQPGDDLQQLERKYEEIAARLKEIRG